MTEKRAQTVAVEQIDPKTLVLGENVRRDARLTPDFVASIKELGVLQPITAQRREDGTLAVVYGQRRTLAAVEAGLTTVPVMVVEGDRDDAQRIIEQMAENDHRAAMLDTERVAAVEQLAIIGLTAEQIASRMHRPPEEVHTALRVAKADKARTVMEEVALTLDQAALLAEFEDDEETTASLRVEFAEGRRGEHVAQRARERAARLAARQEVEARLAEEGVRVVPQPSYDDKTVVAVAEFADGNNPSERLTAEAHASCPGHVAWIVQDWQKAEPVPVYGCDAHKGRHKRFTYGSPSPVSTEERREVRENNAAWRAATTVRQTWIKRELLSCKKVPKDAERFIAQAIAAQMAGEMGEMYRRLTGAKTPEAKEGWQARPAAVESLARASATRAVLAALGMSLAQHESMAEDASTWRRPGADVRRYLAALVAWGYEPSPIEQKVLDSK